MAPWNPNFQYFQILLLNVAIVSEGHLGMWRESWMTKNLPSNARYQALCNMYQHLVNASGSSNLILLMFEVPLDKSENIDLFLLGSSQREVFLITQ